MTLRSKIGLQQAWLSRSYVYNDPGTDSQVRTFEYVKNQLLAGIIGLNPRFLDVGGS